MMKKIKHRVEGQSAKILEQELEEEYWARLMERADTELLSSNDYFDEIEYFEVSGRKVSQVGADDPDQP